MLKQPIISMLNYMCWLVALCRFIFALKSDHMFCKRVILNFNSLPSRLGKENRPKVVKSAASLGFVPSRTAAEFYCEIGCSFSGELRLRDVTHKWYPQRALIPLRLFLLSDFTAKTRAVVIVARSLARSHSLMIVIAPIL